MKHNKKITLVACLAALVGAAGFGTIGASASTEIAQPASFAVVNVASVKTAAPYGIRFTANISKADYDALASGAGEQGVTYGMLLCPADYLADSATLDFDETDGLTEYTDGTNANGQFRNVVVEPQEVLDGEGNVTGYTFTAGIAGILENNVSRPFAARAYAAVDGQVVYTDVFARSIYTTATYVVEDTTASTGVDGYLNGVINKVESVYTTKTVEIQSSARDFTYDMVHVGETFDVVGKVSNGTRTLESKATLKNTANVEYVSGKTYKVTAIGAIDTTATVGKDSFEVSNRALSSKEQYLSDLKAKVTGVEHEDGTVTAPAGGIGNNKWSAQGVYDLSYVESYEGVKDVVKYSPTNATCPYFTNKETVPAEGQYWVADVNWNSSCQLEAIIKLDGVQKSVANNMGFWGGLTGALTADATNEDGTTETVNLLEWKWLNTLGQPAEKAVSSNLGNWMKLQLYVPEYENHEIEVVGIAFYRWTAADNYFANIRRQDYALGVASVDSLEIVEGEKEVYATGDEVAFELCYTDTIGRAYKAGAGNATVVGNATITDEGKVKIGRYGDATVSVTFEDDTVSYDLAGPTTTKVAASELSHGYAGYDVVDASTITVEEKWLGHSDVAVYQNKGNGGYIGLGLGAEIESLLQVGHNIYFDVLMSSCCGPLLELGATMKYFDPLTGEALASVNFNAGNHLSHGTGKWYRVAMEGITKLPAKAVSIFGTYASTAATERTICFANVVVSSVSLIKEDGTVEPSVIVTDKADNWGEDNTINLMPYDKLGYYMWTGLNSGGPAPADVYAATTLGGEACFEWVAAQNAATKAQFLCLNTAACRYLPIAGSIYSLEVYLTGEATLDFSVINTVDNVLNGGAKGYYSTITCYDKATGEKLENANLKEATNHNKWIVIEVAVVNTTYDPNPTRDGIGVSSIAEGTQIYFRNIQLRKTSQFA